jgi:hypothetical protein
MFGTSFLSIYAQGLRASRLSGLTRIAYTATSRPARPTFLTAQQQKTLLLALFAVAKRAHNARVRITYNSFAQMILPVVTYSLKRQGRTDGPNVQAVGDMWRSPTVATTLRKFVKVRVSIAQDADHGLDTTGAAAGLSSVMPVKQSGKPAGVLSGMKNASLIGRQMWQDAKAV